MMPCAASATLYEIRRRALLRLFTPDDAIIADTIISPDVNISYYFRHADMLFYAIISIDGVLAYTSAEFRLPPFVDNGVVTAMAA